MACHSHCPNDRELCISQAREHAIPKNDSEAREFALAALSLFFCPYNSANFLNKVTYKKIALKNCSLRRKNETPCKKKVQFYRQLYADQLSDKIAT